MRIAILGGGTSGFMAAAHLTRQFPSVSLVHLFDPTMPIIGVGEGTTPGFHSWLDEIGPISFDVLSQTCDATTKHGVQFEGWGRARPQFVHDFLPVGRVGLHLSATHLIRVLHDYVRADVLHERVVRVTQQARRVTLELGNDTTVQADLLIDARGFPKEKDAACIDLTWIPTNAALLTRGEPIEGLERTRAVARPHGWVFVIPLKSDTSYGYIHDTRSTQTEVITDDFMAFLRSEAAEPTTPFRRIVFPNFLNCQPFAGRVFKLGNATSFIEPLEATSLAIIKMQLHLLSSWLRLRRNPIMADRLIGDVNREIVEQVLETSLFVGWHYAAGSAYDTAFWNTARQRFDEAFRAGVPKHIRRRFEEHVRIASTIPAEALASAATSAELDALLPTDLPKAFGGMTPVGFAQIARGLFDPTR